MRLNARTGRPRAVAWCVTGAVVVALGFAGCGGDDEPAAGSAATGSEEPAELTKVTLRTDWLANGSHTGFYVAKDQGFYDDEGLDVQIEEGQGSTQTVQLVGTGKEDFGFVASVALTAAVAEGAPVKTIATIVQENPAGILVRGETGIEEPADLEGKTCAISEFGYINKMLPAFYAKAGLPPDAMKTVSVDAEAVLPSIKSGNGRVQALCDMLYEDVDLEVSGTPAKAFRFSDYDINVLAHGIVTNDKLLAEQPEVAEKFVRASLKGFEWAFENRDEAIAIEKELEPDMNVAQQRRVLDLVADRVHTPNSEGEPLGYMAPEDWQESVDLMTEYLGLDESKLPDGVEGLYTNEFIPGGQK
jgi:NitT/TauT family transport system substrate-binding protein